ncbi:MAG: AAA family ATPase, partial [Sideroxyarcus sp.]|nr:AAA family ATPase [Sideroxyarcus sp.]
MQLPFVETLADRLSEKSPKIQVILGPRQVGKTTGIQQLLKKADLPWVYFTGDDLLAPSREVILEQWQLAMQKGNPSLLVIDEIHKVPRWSEIIKKL